MEFTQENFDGLLMENTSLKSALEKFAKDLEASQNDTKIQAEARMKEAEGMRVLQSENETITKINDELVAKIEELSAVKGPVDLAKKANEVKTVSTPKESFEVDGVKYKFIAPVFMFKKERIVAADVINDSAKLAELVAAKLGTIQKV